MLDLLLLPFHLAFALLAFAGSIVLFPLRLVFNLAFGFVVAFGVLFLAGGILSALLLVNLAPGLIFCLLGFGILLTLGRR